MIFIDSGAFIARHLKEDQYYEPAIKKWERIEEESAKCFTSNFVLNETFTYLARKTGYPFALERAKGIYLSPKIKILRPSEEDELKALDLFQKFADQQIGFTDCISFILMKNERLTNAFSFDKHFEFAGFHLL